MIISSNFFPSANRLVDVHYFEYTPEGEVGKTLIIAHGIGEHAGRYEELAEKLNAKGIAIFAIDFIGHGRSVGPDQEPMYFGENGWDYLVKDLISLNKIVKEKYPKNPCYVLGFSMGSFVVRTAMAERANELHVDGAILAGTGNLSPFVANLVKTVVAGEAKKCGGASNVSEKVNDMAFGNYNKYFKPCKTQYDWLCSNADGIKNYIEDPMTNKFITPGMFMDLLGGMARVNRKVAIESSKKIPVLFLTGEEDPVGEFVKGVKKIVKAFMACNPDVDFEIYPNSRHDIFHDNNKEVVMSDIYMWMKEH